MAEDPQKVAKRLEQLNEGISTFEQKWLALPDYYAFTKVEIKIGNAVFFPNSGVPIKIFVKNDTGELRVFPASAFEG